MEQQINRDRNRLGMGTPGFHCVCQSWRHAWIIAAFLVGTDVGCASLGSHPPYPDDPLLLSRKPVEGKADTSEPLLLALAEPAFPSLPAEAFVIAPNTRKRNGPPSQVAAMPVSRRKPPGLYGHAADYSWLQGIVNQFAPGCYELYYCETAADDTLGGKVRLVEDPRLTSLQTGDLIAIDGEVLAKHDGPARRPRQWTPDYRIRESKLLQRAE